MGITVVEAYRWVSDVDRLSSHAMVIYMSRGLLD